MQCIQMASKQGANTVADKFTGFLITPQYIQVNNVDNKGLIYDIKVYE